MNNLAANILEWHKDIDRDLPWKHTDDPYFIWLSEVIMQQTRVAQGTPYYLSFVRMFPTVKSLADASEEEVFKVWEGLGYYSRARNLHKAAKYVSYQLNGIFPKSYDELLDLPGVGPYTAAAIASFAYNENKAVLDGNVFRVISRIYDIDVDILSSAGKKLFKKLADDLLPLGFSAQYNQAIMDFGAVVCVPRKPACLDCPINTECEALRNKTVSIRPIKKKAKPKRLRFFHFFDSSLVKSFLIQKREASDIWQGLFQFPLIETEEDQELGQGVWSDYLGASAIEDFKIVSRQSQLLSHQRIQARFYQGIPLALDTSKKTIVKESQKAYNVENISSQKQGQIDNTLVIPISELDSYAFPKIINTYLDSKVAL